MLYKYLLKCLLQERARRDIKSIVTALQMEKLSLVQAQIQLNQINHFLKQKSIQEQNKPKPRFVDNIFLIGSIVLGSLVTISSFIWGVI